MRKSLYIKSNTFQNAIKKAAEIVSDKEKMSSVIDQTQDKLKNTDYIKSSMDKFLVKIKTMIRLVKAYIDGTYKDLSLKNVVLIVAGLLYFIMPLDFIPDFLPGIGYIDDISIVLAIFKTVSEEIAGFEAFEKERNTIK